MGYKRCDHKWKDLYIRNYIGYTGIKWCKKCGAINQDGDTRSPKFYLKNCWKHCIEEV